MTPDEARLREVREWLVKASDDLASARILAEANQLANALFHCQQAAEKSLKAFLTWNQTPFRRTHDLEELGESCIRLDSTMTELMKDVEALSGYAWKLRYPGSPYVPEQDEMDAMFKIASTVFRETQERLPLPARVTQG